MKKTNSNRYSKYAVGFFLASAGLVLLQACSSSGGGSTFTPAEDPIIRVSVNSAGESASGGELSDISGDGRYVAYGTDATNLIDNDTNNTDDVYVKDIQTGEFTRVSVATDGTEGNASSFETSISDDARYIAFKSIASNLVSGDANGFSDIFLHDRDTGITTRISEGVSGESNGSSDRASISGNGQYIVFQSLATNLVAADGNASSDIFVYDRLGTTGNKITRVSVDSSGIEAELGSFAPSINFDGQYITFHSAAINLITPADTNTFTDVFLHDTVSGDTVRVSPVSIVPDFGSRDPVLSGDGRYLSFVSGSTNLLTTDDTNSNIDVFRYDIVNQSIILISVDSFGAQSNGRSDDSKISHDGRYVSFNSDASNLITTDSNGVQDIYVRDTIAGTTYRVSLAFDGAESLVGNSINAFSADGKYITFHSNATNLVSGGTNNEDDIYRVMNKQR